MPRQGNIIFVIQPARGRRSEEDLGGGTTIKDMIVACVDQFKREKKTILRKEDVYGLLVFIAHQCFSLLSHYSDGTRIVKWTRAKPLL